ncbi:MAG: hypothetical protein O7G88_22190 [bacterium]|nr:hypothetical protein [bacterium]
MHGHDRFSQTDCYILPSTTFVRHDYSELFKVEAIHEAGRNDSAKLGYMIVKVYEHGHTAEVVRSYGETLAPGATLSPVVPRIAAIHTKNTDVNTFGVDLRYPWADIMEITPSGAVDEFERKKARNDYLLLAFWKMGLRKMRASKFGFRKTLIFWEDSGDTVLRAENNLRWLEFEGKARIWLFDKKNVFYITNFI